MDADVAELVRQDRLLDAARLSQSRGDARTASALFERACAWASAASEALADGDAGRALDLAIRAGDDALAEDAARRVGNDPARGPAAAEQLARRGEPRWAARVHESAGRALDAARAWEQAGDAVRAAAQFERAGQPAQAARVLEGALRREPPLADAAAAALALGTLFVRFGKDEAAVRALQRVPASAPERRDAIVPLIAALGRLGLAGAVAEAKTELAGLTASDPALPSPAAAVQSRLDVRYEVVREVASSPRAQVLECIDHARAERVAVKRFSATLRDSGPSRGSVLGRFEAEARTLAALHHPAIVAVRDVLPQMPAVVLAWMAGGSLDAFLARARGPLAPARAVEIASAVLDALGAAHRLGILHRGIRPSNVLFDAGGAAHLSDFGASRLADATATVSAADASVSSFLSPEQRHGLEPTAASDLFAVGVLLGEMLCGPDAGGSAGTNHARPSGAHRGLDTRHDAVVARLRAADPHARPADAFEARSLLQSLPWPADVDGGRDPAAPTAGTVPPPAPERLRQEADGRWIDTHTGRAIARVPLSDATLARARAFARAGSEALQTVLRVDRAAGALWLEDAAPLARPPTADEAERLEAALAALAALVQRGQLSADEALDRTRLLVAPSGGVVIAF